MVADVFQADAKVFFYLLQKIYGVRGSVVVKALCYKPEGRGFDSR
jgi:hypothetical protein